jgi:hypothetical protein
LHHRDIIFKLIICSILCLTAHESAASEDKTIANIGSIGFLELPSNSQLVKDNKTMPDFSFYYVEVKKKPILTIYVGNAPDLKPEKNTKIIKFDGCDATSRVFLNKASKNRDVLIYIDNLNQFPKYLQLSYRNLSSNDALQANNILKSFHFVNGYGCERNEITNQ